MERRQVFPAGCPVVLSRQALPHRHIRTLERPLLTPSGGPHLELWTAPTCQQP
uniref:Uncharacterized protein n=1 Tax=Anguilla anguilla TaxID=7936 RepID=A0A0E9SZH8_ANGAN